MSLVFHLFATIIDVFTYLILINVIGSWIRAANVRLPTFLYDILAAIDSIVDPVLAPIRRLMPNLGGLDFSPLIALILLQVISQAFHSM
jgi:YggT family protein